jgi:glycosyltransferase involved in cell wall biosynthesis
MQTTIKKKKVCFVCPYAYPLFDESCQSPFGGSEVRLAILAKGLADIGDLEVSMIVFDHNQPPFEVRQGVRLIAWKDKRHLTPVLPSEGKSKSRVSFFDRILFLRKLYGIVVSSFEHLTLRVFAKIRNFTVYQRDVSIFEDESIDIFMIAGNSELTSVLLAYCKVKGKKAVLLAGSDGDFDPLIIDSPETMNSYGVPHYLMRYNLENADIIVVQTKQQQKILRDIFQKEALLLRNPINLSSAFTRQVKNRIILWIGKSDRVKRPELALDLATLFPEFKFHLVVSYSDPFIFSEVDRRAKASDNVRLSLYIPFNQIESCFAEAALFLSTSVFEGFPNTFLQAAKYGVPIVSLNVDPDGMLSSHGCGKFCSGDLDCLAQSISDLMRDENENTRIGALGIAYVRKFHDNKNIIDAFNKIIIENILNNSGVRT